MTGIHVLFVATDRDRCAKSATRLEKADDGFEVAGATCASGVKRALRETRVDCVVFGENPLSPDGSQLLDVVEAVETGAGPNAGGIPVVLFTDRSYGPATARETDGIAGYVRSGGEGAYDHLADRIRWTVGGSDPDEGDWYETLVESMDDGVLVLDEGCRIRYANAAMGEAFGLEREAFVGEHLTALAVEQGPLDRTDAESVCAAVESVLAGDAAARSPEVAVEPDAGEPRVVELHVVSLPGQAPGGALATVRNVTEYKQTESALEDTRSKIERLHAVTDEMTACRSERELFELTVDAVERILEVDVCGVDIVDGDEFVPRATMGEDYGRSPVASGIGGRAFRAGDSILVDDVRDRADASPVEGARSVLAVPVDNRGLLRAVARRPDRLDERDRNLAELLVAHVGESLTRIRVGKTLQERQRDLVAERERLIALFENVPSPVVSYELEDGRPVIRDANESFQVVFGVDIDAALGDPLGEHVGPTGETTDDDVPTIHERLAAGEQVTAAVRRTTADCPRDFLVHAGPLSDRDGEGFLIYTDISDQKQRERELEAHSDRLDEFATVAVTDLRTGLNEARGYLEVAQETGDDEHFSQVRRAHEEMSRLIDQLRYLAQPDAGVESTEPLHVEEVTTRAWASVETGGTNLEVEDVTVEADAERLEELIEQLFRNAVDHAAPEEDPLSGGLDDATDLTVRVGPLEDGAGFYVEDTGQGIPLQDRNRVFEDGYTTGDGTGLGLSVVERIAEGHGWSVTLTESDEGGARFEFAVGTNWQQASTPQD